MSSDEPLNPSTTATTSKFFTFFDTDVSSLSFEKLIIDCDSNSSTNQKTEMPVVVTNPLHFRVPEHRSGRFTPYSIPFGLRRRSKSCPSITMKKERKAELEVMQKVRLKGDVEALKLCILEKKDMITPCSIQAARPPSPDDDIDELSEYFSHFVRVESKMSALAESMYV